MYLNLFLILAVSGMVLLLLGAAVMAGEKVDRSTDVYETSPGRVENG